MHDNAEPHRTALLLNEYLEIEDIPRMECPYLKLIGYFWDALGRVTANRSSLSSENHPGSDNSVSERVGPIDQQLHKGIFYV